MSKIVQHETAQLADGNTPSRAYPSRSLRHITFYLFHEISPLEADELMRHIRFVFVQIWRKLLSISNAGQTHASVSFLHTRSFVISQHEKHVCLCAHLAGVVVVAVAHSLSLCTFGQLFFSSLLFYSDGKCSTSVCKFRVRGIEAV